MKEYTVSYLIYNRQTRQCKDAAFTVTASSPAEAEQIIKQQLLAITRQRTSLYKTTEHCIISLDESSSFGGFYNICVQ